MIKRTKIITIITILLISFVSYSQVDIYNEDHKLIIFNFPERNIDDLKNKLPDGVYYIQRRKINGKREECKVIVSRKEKTKSL